MRAARALIGVSLVALVCVAAAVGAGQKVSLRIEGVSHTYGPSGSYLCVKVQGTAGAALLVEAYGPGVGDGHAFTQALLPRSGRVLVGFALKAEGAHRVKVTATKKKQGRSVATRDYVVPSAEVAPAGPFACTG